MKLLNRDSLPLGGFAGLRKHRIVTDSRLFGAHKSPATSEGIGNFVYLADAQFNPLGETGMHPHKEIDVISVMVEGRVAHEGSLEHGKSLEQGDVQVQRAGSEGFSHNEINPDTEKNRMIQLWVLPEQAGEAADYQYFSPEKGKATRIYGGNGIQAPTFKSKTTLDIVHLDSEQEIQFDKEVLIYVYAGQASFLEKDAEEKADSVKSIIAEDGHLIRGKHLTISAPKAASMIVVSDES